MKGGEFKIAKQKENLLPREQVISTVLGMVVVIIVGTLVYRYFQKGEGLEMTNNPIEETTENSAGFVMPTDLPATYQVQANDTLWKIAEMHYGSGYNWIDIASENKLSSADLLAVGQELTIPDTAAKTLTVEKQITDSTINPGEYTVQEGDWLSKIALRAYGDMYAWEKIYEANKEAIGPNPDNIEVGQVLTIPN